MLSIGNNIKRIREYKNLTQEAVAEKAGMSVTAYGNIERGATDVNFRKLADIAEALEVKEEDIVMLGSTNHYNTFQANSGTGIIYTSGDTHVTNNEKELYEKMLKDKDEEIAFLREQLKMG